MVCEKLKQSGKGFVNEEETTEYSKDYAESPEFLPAFGLSVLQVSLVR